MTHLITPKHSLVKRCTTFYRIRTERAYVPNHLRQETRLPGDPVGDAHTGYALRRRELLTLAFNDKALGGDPRIEKIPGSVCGTLPKESNSLGRECQFSAAAGQFASKFSRALNNSRLRSMASLLL